MFLRDESKLLITHDIFGDWDLPGGRIKPEEFEKPLETVIARKMREEIGENVQYELGRPNGTLFRVKRKEQKLGEMVKIFAVGYDANYLGGAIELGNHHDKFEWVNVRSFQPEDYFNGGWLAGVQDYISLVTKTPKKIKKLSL